MLRLNAVLLTSYPAPLVTAPKTGLVSLNAVLLTSYPAQFSCESQITLRQCLNAVLLTSYPAQQAKKMVKLPNGSQRRLTDQLSSTLPHFRPVKSSTCKSFSASASNYQFFHACIPQICHFPLLNQSSARQQKSPERDTLFSPAKPPPERAVRNTHLPTWGLLLYKLHSKARQRAASKGKPPCHRFFSRRSIAIGLPRRVLLQRCNLRASVVVCHRNCFPTSACA